MRLFGKGKSLPEQAEDERAKMQKKQAKLQSERLDTMMLEERRRKSEAMRRLQA